MNVSKNESRYFKYPLFPNIIRAIKYIDILPLSNAEIKRCFSTLNYIKTNLRSRTLGENLNDLIFVFK